jgi:two-component sensor histidine kinase
MLNGRKSDASAPLRQQTALAALGTFALHSEDLQQVLNEAARLCAEGGGVPFCKILEHRSERGDLVLRAGVGWRQGVIGEAVAKADRSNPVGRAFVTGKPVITTDLRQPHDFALPPIYLEHGIVSSANVLIEGFGVLEIDSAAPHGFSDNDVIFLVGFANVCAETVARLQRQRALQQLVKDRGTFLRELQHRVRNHLHMLVSLAHVLSGRTNDAEAKRGFDEMTRRIMALATLYDRLLGVRMAQRLDLGRYVAALCDNILELGMPQERQVDLRCRVEPIEVSLETATAVGIIANELVANSLEHAFGDGPGRVVVALERGDEGRARLVVADNGTGMPARPRGLGLNLVRRLAQQVGGTLELKQGEGTRWELDLPTAEAPATTSAAPSPVAGGAR